ncbi:uncharacterized protein Z520_06831 [Fonsecaea multimorphosa CBS 102226]|uniref:RRM domain-containing protein n=1 Tax=Fonsecaea multimorphosa CBS 102226 TaxID=1442371 RepID=A0A0D2K2S9_9EURO|nr:uncharacterized protein Z520_06831 [Fonsecaea multimorphosa CBS 102226]KIX97379.1 hypothetical protein Z520_06831 [Fonsecaea multimorphosa CBS 102226]OAL23347.1 hypothetical protein AYO22_06397 [Fonsecaea multimorphosa]
MTSRLASSPTSPRRALPTLPLLPITFPRSSSSTPNPEIVGISEDAATEKLDGEQSRVEEAQAAQGSTSLPASLKDANTTVADQPAIQPSAEDDVFGAQSSVTNSSVPMNTVARRIINNLRTPAGYNGFAPRPDRVNQVPTPANAQGLYPPTAAIFVANLSKFRSEDQLEVSCHQTFDTYGPNHVKIRRDKNLHPFAFIQFQKDEDANAAVSGAYGLIMDGRKIRIEQARAERAVILSKTDGTMITEAETRGLLERYGTLESVTPTTMANKRHGGSGNGMYVKFAFYLDCRDALKLFQNHTNGYQLYMAPSLEPRIRPGPDGAPVVTGFANPRSSIDQKSIYVGNLPEGTTRAHLEELFAEFGVIVQVNIIKKTYENDAVNIFAFVEFAHAHEADRAASAERYLHGLKLRVEQKEYSARRPSGRLMAPNMGVQQQNNRPRREYGNRNASYQNNMNYTPQVYNRAHGQQAVGPHGMPAHQFTPPATIQYNHQGMPQPMYGTPQHQTSAYGFGNMTPPSYGNMNHMLPAGIFSPTPTHNMDHNQYNNGFAAGPANAAPHPPQFYQSPNGYVGHSIPTIPETHEEGQY